MNVNWLKLDVGILDDAKIRLIRKHPDGNALFVLWIGLLCLAMKSTEPGCIEVSDGIPYTVEDLAMIFDVEHKTVQLGLTLFERYRMIEIRQGGLIEIINFRKHQSLDKIDRQRELTRERVRKFREKRHCNALLTRYDVTSNATDKIREDKIREDKIRLETEGTISRGEYEGGCASPPSPSRSAFIPPSVDEVTEYCKTRGNNVDAATFVDHYEAKGWMIGKNKMRDWRAAVRTWERREPERRPRRVTTKTEGNYAILEKIYRESRGEA